MSGAPSWATTEPSRNSTRPCTTDCGCTTTSICSERQGEQMMRLDQFQPLVHQGGRIDGDLRPHRPVRVAQRLLRRGGRDGLAAPGAERPARGGQDDARRPRGGPAPIAWNIALCSESTGRMVAPTLGRAAHEQAAGADQALLVGERDGRAALDGGQRRLQPARAGDRRHHPVGRPLRPPRSGPPRRPPASMPLPAERVLEFGIGLRIGHHGEARRRTSRASLASAAALRRAVTASTR